MKDFGRFFIIFLFIAAIADGQTLIKNPGFEEYTRLPIKTGQWNRVKHWLLPDLQNGEEIHSGDGPDYFHLKGSIAHTRLPSPKWMSDTRVYPYEGSAVAGIMSLNEGNTHEYITAPLTTKITKGERVKVSFYYCNGGRISIGEKICRLGVYFSDIIPLSLDKAVLKVKPQAEMKIPMFSKEWTLFEGEFVAGHDYHFITIGCFHDTNKNDFHQGTTEAMFNDWSYYFLDAVNVEIIR